MGAFYMSTVMVIYLLWYWPFEQRFNTAIEFFNEVTTVLMLYVAIAFTDYVPDAEVRYGAGWPFIGVQLINCGIHIFFLVKDVIRQLKLIHKNKRCFRGKLRQDRAVIGPAAVPRPANLRVVEEVCSDAEHS